MAKFLIVLLLALVSATVIAASCDKEQYVKEAYFYVNGQERAHGDEKIVREMMLSATGVSHHKKMRKAVFNAFQRPRANILFLVDESATTCAVTPKKIQKIAKRFYKRSRRHGKQPFVVSVAASAESATAPVKRIAKHGHAHVAFFDAQKQSIVLQQNNQELFHFEKKQDAYDVAAEIEAIKAVVSKLPALKTEAEKNSHAPDFYFFTVSSLKAIAAKYGKQSTEYTAARKQITDAIAEVFAAFNKLYDNEKIVSQVMFTDDRASSEINMQVGKAQGRKLMSTANVFIVNQSSNTTSNSTTPISAYDIADYQIWVWVWVMAVACLAVAFYVMGSIDYSADCLNYAADFSKHE